MRDDLPPWAIWEERFAEWCAAREMDENDESWRAFEMWIDEGGPT